MHTHLVDKTVMNKIRTFEIIFRHDHLEDVYRVGENIVGYVSLKLTERMSVKDISILIQGKAEVNFQSGKRTHSETQKYFRDIQSLFSSKESNESFLEAGAHEFNFEYFLPLSLPCSFEGNYGHVRYTVEAKINRGLWKTSINKTRNIIVRRDLNLNSHLGIQGPVRYESNTTDYRTGSLGLVVHLPRKGYVPGDNILVDANITNDTAGSGNVSVELFRFTTYRTKSGSKRWKQTICTKPSSVVNPGDTVELSRQSIHFPNVPPTGLPGCRLIDIKYTLRVQVQVNSLVCKIPVDITIGTIPLLSLGNRSVLEPPSYQSSGQLYELPSSPPGYTAIRTSGPFPLPPPTYQESTRKSVSRGRDVTTHL